MQRSEYIKRILKAILFTALLVIFTEVLDAAFLLDEKATEEMLVSYSQTNEIDTLFIGNCVGEMMDARLYSELTDTHSFNMSTPSQSLEISLDNIKLASSHHNIRTVTLLMTLDTVSEENYRGIEQLHARVIDSSSPLKVRILNWAKRSWKKSTSDKVVNTEESINVYFPWQNETAHGIDSISDNLKRRFGRLINNKPLGHDIAFDLNTKKYLRNPGDLTAADRTLLEEDIQNASSLNIPTGMISPDNLTLLAKISSFCRDNNILFRAIVTPHRTDYYDRYAAFRDYSETTSAFLNDFLSKRNNMYYNTEDDPGVHDRIRDEYFNIEERLNSDYYDKSTLYLHEIISMMDKSIQED